MDHAASLPLPALSLPAEEESCPDEAPAVAPTDEDLLERVAGGDTEAFTCCTAASSARCSACSLRLAGRRALAEEWLQETFTRVWRAAATHDRSRGAGRSWIFAIALNTARRQMGRLSSRAAHVPIDDAAPSVFTTAPRPARSRSRSGSTRSEGARPSPARSPSCPEFLREVVVLRCSRELSFAEIAEVTGAPQGTLKSRFHRAVAALRERLHDEGEPRGTRRPERGRRS